MGTSKRGGARPGAGRKLTVCGGRAWIREILDDADRRKRFANALDAALVGWARSKNPSEAAGVAVRAYLRAFEHGYGRPPQALDPYVEDHSDVDRVLNHLLRRR